MLVARVYTVMDSLVVEVSCVHPGDVPTSHLLFREERAKAGLEEWEQLRALADAVDLASYVSRARYDEALPATPGCPG